MLQAASSTTRQELLAYAAERGFPVSAAQFKRWRMADLLPPPMAFEGAGQGHGRKAARYPIEAGPQLVAVAQALERNRDVDAASWRLWWEGYAIDASRVRPLLESALERMEDTRRVLDAVLDDDITSERFEAALTKRSSDKFVTRIRRRVGKNKYVGFVLMLYQLVNGMPNHDSEDRKDFLKGLGIPDSQFIREADALNVVRQVVNVGSLRDALANTNEDALANVRGELAQLWGWLRGLFSDTMPNSLVTEVGTAADILREATAQAPLEEFVLVWLRVRRHWLFPLWYPFFAARFARPFAEWENERPPVASIGSAR